MHYVLRHSASEQKSNLLLSRRRQVVKPLIKIETKIYY
jgi:hypothetical protein